VLFACKGSGYPSRRRDEKLHLALVLIVLVVLVAGRASFVNLQSPFSYTGQAVAELAGTTAEVAGDDETEPVDQPVPVTPTKSETKSISPNSSGQPVSITTTAS